MAPYSTHATQCLELAAATAPALLSRAIEQAVASLQQEEDRAPKMAQRQELADAWLALTRSRADWSQRYPDLLRQAQFAPAREMQPGPAAAPAEDDRFGGLTLVDEEAVTREIESARLLQLLAARLEQPLAELDALMSTALGLATVQPESNPLRPQIFADALGELMQPEQQPQMARLWSRHLAAPLAGELEAVYREAVQLLRDAQVEAATYRVLPSGHAPLMPTEPEPESRAEPGMHPHAAQGDHGGWGEGHGDGPGPAEGAPPSLGVTGPLGGASWADLSGYALGDELFQNFLFSRSQPSSQPLAPAYYAKVDAQVSAIERAGPDAFEPFDAAAVQSQRSLAPVERPHRPVGTARTLDTSVWGRWAQARERSLHRSRLKKEARQVGQVLGLEVVRKLVDQVARDPRLLAPVREAVVALEPALARLALVAPRFFAQEDHAGRRLVERVAERSFRYNDEFASDFDAFFEGVRSAFQGLNDAEVEDDGPFAQALGRLEQRWSDEDALAEAERKVAVDAVHFAEAREAEAAQIAWGMSQRSDLDGAPAVVQDFLFGPWALVMAHARLTDTTRQIDPGGWTAIVSDLLWSVKTEQTLREPARLFAILPGLLEKLRSGLALLGQDATQHENFYAALEKLHRPVLKLRAKSRHARHGLDAEPQLDEALLSTRRQQPRPPGGAPWLTPKELHAAGFEEERTSAPAPLEATTADAETGAIIAGLRQGCWVDLYVREGWRRASLSWVSSRQTLFMFVSNGRQPHSMTRRSLERLVRERLLRPVDAAAVVPRAIEALSQQRREEAREARAQRAASEDAVPA